MTDLRAAQGCAAPDFPDESSYCHRVLACSHSRRDDKGRSVENGPSVDQWGRGGCGHDESFDLDPRDRCLLALKAAPVRLDRRPASRRVDGLVSEVFVSVTAGLSVKVLLTPTAPSVSESVYVPCGREGCRVQAAGPRLPLASGRK